MRASVGTRCKLFLRSYGILQNNNPIQVVLPQKPLSEVKLVLCIIQRSQIVRENKREARDEYKKVCPRI